MKSYDAMNDVECAYHEAALAVLCWYHDYRFRAVSLEGGMDEILDVVPFQCEEDENGHVSLGGIITVYPPIRWRRKLELATVETPGRRGEMWLQTNPFLPKIEAVADALLEERTLSHDEVYEICEAVEAPQGSAAAGN